MKNYKFISIVLLLLLSFLGSTELYKYSSESNNCQTQDFFLVADIPQVLSSALSMANDVDLHFILKNKIKKRVLGSETNELKYAYDTNLVRLKTLKDNLIYSSATLLKSQRHTHLHLYQLF